MSEFNLLLLQTAKSLFYEQKQLNSAALLAGNVLIECLLQIGARYGITRSIIDAAHNEKNAGDRLNQELLNRGVYNAEVHDQLRQWLTIRTEAAKNREDYTTKEVERMLEGIGKFAENYLSN